MSPASISTRSCTASISSTRSRSIWAAEYSRKDDGGQNQVPGVFGGVLLPRSVGQWSAAKDLFQLVGFDEKFNLLSETIGHCESIMSLPRKAPA